MEFFLLLQSVIRQFGVKQHGQLDPAVGQAFRNKVLSRGNTKDQLQTFTDFTGMEEPDASVLLKTRGL